jgi:hypothetical protein
MDGVFIVALDARTAAPRTEALERAHLLLRELGVALADERLFENDAVVLAFECEPSALADVLDALPTAGFALGDAGSARCRALLEAAASGASFRATLLLGFEPAQDALRSAVQPGRG